MAIRTVFRLVAVALVLVISLSLVSAIKASIGNSRIVLRDVKPGDKVERSILVRNVNEENVTIDLVPYGDLAEYIEIKDEHFVLGPGEEMKAWFIITIGKGGTTSTDINVKFTPEEGDSSDLSSTITVFASESALDPEVKSWTSPVVLLSISTTVLALALVFLLVYAARKKQRKSSHD